MRVFWLIVLILFVPFAPLSAEQVNVEALKKKLEQVSGEKRLPLLLQLAEIDLEFPGEKTISLGDEIVTIANSLNDKKNAVRGQQIMAGGYNKIGKHTQALELYFKSRSLAQETGDILGQAKANSEIGNLFYFVYNDFYQAIAYYHKAEVLYEMTKDLFGMAKHQNNMAEVYTKVGEYARAVELYTQALKKLEVEGNRWLSAQVVVLLNVARASAHHGSLDIAWQYANRAQELLKQLHDTWRDAQFMILKGDLFELQGQYPQALAEVTKAQTLMKPALASQSDLASARVDMHTQIQMGRIAMKIGDLKLAERHLNEAKTLFSKGLDQYSYAHLLLNQARLMRMQGDDAGAMALAKENEILCRTNRFLMELREVYRDLAEWLREDKQIEQALHYAQALIHLEQETFQPRMISDVTAIIMKYEQGRVDQRVDRLKRVGFWVFVLMGFGLILLFLGAFYYIRRIKQNNILRLKALEDSYAEKYAILSKSLSEVKEKTGSSSLSREKTEDLTKIVIVLIESEGLYKESELTLDKLAGRLGVNRTYLSQAINTIWGNNFNDFINYFRIKEAKEHMLQSGSSKSMLTIAFEVGFNSKSTFNRVFKEKTGLTPKQYRQIKASNPIPGK